MLSDIFSQALEAMRHNGRRTLTTVIGMAWGIATVVLLLAFGAGFSHAIEAIFEQFGTNEIGIFPGRTSEQAGGEKAGVKVRLTLDDVERLQEVVGGLISASPVVWKNASVANELHTYTWEVDGIEPELQTIQKMDVAAGRPLSAADVQTRAHVAVIGSEAKTKLYSGRDALGDMIRLNGVAFQVVGVQRAKMQEGDDSINRNIFVPFSTMSEIKDTKYIDGIWFSYHGNFAQVEKAARTTLATSHNFSAKDKNALHVANIMEQLSQFRIISLGLQILLSFIGALTLGIAGIGLMNIMLVSVQQRTREIGIEKALGAKRWQVLLQFLAEALAISGAGGVLGILLAYAISLTVGSIPLYSALASNAEAADIHLTISMQSLAVSIGILVVVGVVSGMVPALKAARLDPIEALRFE